jgi:hypothetical protein
MRRPKRVVRRRDDKTRSYRIVINVLAMLPEAVLVVDPHVRETRLPDFPRNPISLPARNEKPPLMICMAFSTLNSPPTVSRMWT